MPSSRVEKDAAKGWYNQHWFAKTLATIQHISKGGVIEVGAGDRLFAVSATPKSWTCPVSIDAGAIERMMEEQRESRLAQQESTFDSE